MRSLAHGLILACPQQACHSQKLAASAARAGKYWTDDGTARQQRGLKHRAQHETRTIPIPPVLAQMLRAHLKRYGTAPDGRIFQTARGGHTQDSVTAPSGPTPAPPR